MSRHLRLVRSVEAGLGGWSGDGAVWNGDEPGGKPAGASAPAVEVGSPIFHSSLTPEGERGAFSRGVSGIVRVVGADSSRRFNLSLVLGYTKHNPPDADVVTWQILTGATALEIGDGEDFTTLPDDLPLQDFAFHLVPVGGDLAEGSRVEIWAAEV